MPRAPRRKPRAPRRRRVVRRRRQGPREWAEMKETHTFSLLPANSAFYDYATSLARFQRASQIGHNYREFRITKLEYMFQPLVDTFTQGDFVANVSQVPYLYAMIDKTGTFRDFNTAEDLQQAGCKPRRLDDKTLKVIFKPSVLSYAHDRDNNTNLWAQPRISPWLSCDKFNDTGTATTYVPSSIDHLGLAWIVDGQPEIKYQLKLTAYFQFRKPGLHDDNPATADVSGVPVPPAQQAE